MFESTYLPELPIFLNETITIGSFPSLVFFWNDRNAALVEEGICIPRSTMIFRGVEVPFLSLSLSLFLSPFDIEIRTMEDKTSPRTIPIGNRWELICSRGRVLALRIFKACARARATVRDKEVRLNMHVPLPRYDVKSECREHLLGYFEVSRNVLASSLLLAEAIFRVEEPLFGAFSPFVIFDQNCFDRRDDCRPDLAEIYFE